MTPLVSVDIPIYNGAKHLRESVDSVLAQTFNDFGLGSQQGQVYYHSTGGLISLPSSAGKAEPLGHSIVTVDLTRAKVLD